jgi:5-methyltetrahydrofolate--homocysteine methyltransferase
MKPDFHFTDKDWNRIERDWTRFWAHDLGRPLIWIECMDPDVPPADGYKRYFPMYPPDMDPEAVIDIETREMNRIRFLGDAFPKRFLNFGPGSAACYFGSELKTGEDTVWFERLGKNLDKITIKTDRQSFWYRRVHAVLDCALETWQGRAQVSHSDIGGNLDLLASLRGTNDLLMDLYDNPERIEALHRDITREWISIFDEETEKIKRVCRGLSPWAPIFSRETTYMLQCDFAFMISPDMFERFVLPELKACVDHIRDPFFHLDGKGQLPHLDMLLAIPGLKGVQWIPGAGQPEPQEWTDVLTRIRKAGKLCQLYLTPEGARRLKKSMPLNGFAIQIVVGDMRVSEAEALFREMTA